MTTTCDRSDHVHASHAESAKCATPVPVAPTRHRSAGEDGMLVLTEARALVARIEAALAATCEPNPHWGHVGSMAHVRSALREINDQLFSEGEYAPEAQ